MYIGLDMGGTHTDAVLIADGQVKKYYKIATDHNNYFDTITNALETLLSGFDAANIKGINLSTTVCTNAITTKKTCPVGLLIEPGPGMNSNKLMCAEKNYVLTGAIDHRGRQTAPLKKKEITKANEELQKAGIKNLAIVGKFSTRNPEHELKIKEMLSPCYDFITLGHQVSGRLNFPRRTYTSFLNSAVATTYASFAGAIKSYIEQKQLPLQPDILKADGGTLSLETSTKMPVETILSGPSASIMGAIALAPTNSDAVILDIGGTTTDIAFLADGIPLFEPWGIEISGYPTLVRALYSYSLGLGGDSCLRVIDGKLYIGPERYGPAYALGGPKATPTDALIALNRLELGDKALSQKCMTQLGEELGLDTESTAKYILKNMADKIASVTKALLNQINSKPVYTIRELIANKKLMPDKIIIVGAPAETLAPEIETSFGIPVEVPVYAQTANAIGAALSRPTTELTLLADTEQKVMTIPELGYRDKIPSDFDLNKARNTALDLLRKRIHDLNPTASNVELEIVEESSFNMVSGFYTTGKNIRVKVQVKPQVISLQGGRSHA